MPRLQSAPETRHWSIVQAVRCTFQVGEEPGPEWVEEHDPPPEPGDTITHDGKSYVVQTFPLYQKQRGASELTVTFKLTPA